MLLYYPVRTGFYRASLLFSFAGILLCLTLLLWRRRFLRWLPLALPTATLILLLPGRPADPLALRTAYTASLASYTGTRYVWGGENWRGVDCSGLLRSALVDAHFKESLRTFNPALARQGLWFWWHDASARELGDGYQGCTQSLSAPTPLKDLPPALLQPGDLAVTGDGSHVLAYLGNATWIEADPYSLKVLTLTQTSGTHDSSWWNMKVIPCRWTCLTPR